MPDLTRRSFLPIAPACLWALACFCGDAQALMAGASPDDPRRRVDANRPDSPWSGVGAVCAGDAVFSGVLIGTRFALTAAHAVAHAQSSIRFTLNIGGPQPASIAVARVVVHPEYRGGAGPSAPHDLALLELAEAAPAAARIHPLYAGEVSPGTPLLFVGYGASGQGDSGPSVAADPTVKRIGTNEVDRLGARDPSGQALVFAYDFDGPGRPNAMGGTGMRADRESIAAQGDSGAPAFIRRAGRWELAGILTFVTAKDGEGMPAGTFGTVGGGLLLAPSRDWILQTVAGQSLARPYPRGPAQPPAISPSRQDREFRSSAPSGPQARIDTTNRPGNRP
ncbi:MAG TPA: trypsin-like serine protease [Burkholderiaceae bacterium]|nr:trypsin-like serine protease [Burkholderiaceae bacterium]